METQAHPKTFNCLFHPNDLIERVVLEPDTFPSLSCIECILQAQSSDTMPPLVAISAFIDKTCDYYSTKGVRRVISTSAPNELVEFLSKEREVVDVFTQHIESTKAKVAETINEALTIVTKLLNNKEKELIRSLDHQLISLKANYAYYKKKIEMFYNQEMAAEFPTTREKMVEIINSFETTQDLEVFVKQVRDDLNSDPQERDHEIIGKLRNFSQDLIKQSSCWPKYSSADLDKKENLLNNFTNQISTLIEQSFADDHQDLITEMSLQVSIETIKQLANQVGKRENPLEVIKTLLSLTRSVSGVKNVVEAFGEDESKWLGLIDTLASSSKGELRQKGILLLSTLLEGKTNQQTYLSTRIEKTRHYLLNYLRSNNETQRGEAIEDLRQIFLYSLEKKDSKCFDKKEKSKCKDKEAISSLLNSEFNNKECDKRCAIMYNEFDDDIEERSYYSSKYEKKAKEKKCEFIGDYIKVPKAIYTFPENPSC